MKKRNKTTLVRAACRNCGAATVGRYCHVCGQDLFAGRHNRLREIVDDTLGNIFSLDGKIFRTLGYLIAFPGRLTNEFFDGRIVRYVFPSKLFWFITIIFFALLWNMADINFNVDVATAETQAGIENTILPETVTEKYDPDDLPFTQEQFSDFFSTWAPYMVLALVPLFAVLVRMFFRRRERFYSDYLVFSLHFNSFFFLLMSVELVVNEIFPDLESVEWVGFAIPAVYLAVALRTVFRVRWVSVVFKTMLLGIFYMFFMTVVLVVFGIFFGISIT